MILYCVTYISPMEEAVVTTLQSKARAELITAMMNQELTDRIANGSGYMHDFCSSYEMRSYDTEHEVFV